MKITGDNWPEEWDKVPAWTPISEEVYDHFLNSLMPVDFHSDHFQAGEAYDAAVDEKGRYRNRYMTFADCGSKGYFYLGLHFYADYPERDDEAIKKALEEAEDGEKG